MKQQKSPSLLGGAMIIAAPQLVQVCWQTRHQPQVCGLSDLFLRWFTLGFV